MEKNILLHWLNNAYSMELGLIQELEKHKTEASDHMEIAEAIGQHIEETKMQADKVKAEIERLGGDISGLKAWGAEAFGWIQGVMSGMFEDKLVKNAISEDASEHFEMATYKAIAKAAEIEGDEQVKNMAGKIMEQEKAMAEKLNQKLDEIVQMYYHDRDKTGETEEI